jgi:uncharacterized SAM-binding protein YcdF (DUF218 family)
VTRALAVLLVAWVAAASYLFLVPHDDEPGRADAIVVLAGSKKRIPVAERLIEQGVAPVLAISYIRDLDDPRAHKLCGDRPRGVVCFRAEPFSTRGEARAIARIARQRGWDEIVVVTSGFHVFRARRIVERCYRGELRMVGAPYEWYRLPQAVLNESMKLAAAELAQRSC